MEANKKFSYKAKLRTITSMCEQVDSLKEQLNELAANELLAALPDASGIEDLRNVIAVLEGMLEAHYEEVEPMAFFEKKSA